MHDSNLPLRIASAATRQRPNHFRRLRFEALEARRVMHGDADSSLLVSDGEGETTPMPDFSLPDVNTASPHFNQGISPRDYLEQVTGWYFGHAS